MDIFFPADLVPTSMMFGVDDFTAVDESATTGAMQSSTLYGTRRWRLRMDFPVLTGARLARFEALVAALRGRQNRVFISPLTRLTRGSFPDLELLPNNTFASGTTSWIGSTGHETLTAQDRALRLKRTIAGQNYGTNGPVTLSLSVPYVGRAMVVAGAGPALFHLNLSSGPGVDAAFPAGSSYSAIVLTPVSIAGPALGIYEATATGGVAGDSFDIPWASVARCALVDNAPNAVLWSDDFSNAAWTKNSATVTTNTAGAPDNTTTMDTLTEAAATAQHYALQTVSRASVAEDRCAFVCAARAVGTRDCALLVDDGSGNGATAIFNLSTGVASSVTATGTGLNPRAFSRDMGGGRWFCWLIAYVPASTSSRTVAYVVSGALSYLGDGASGIYLWRAGNCGSSFPVAGITPTTTVGIAAIGQTGTLLRIKGLPVSTQGLLLQGDIVEIALPSYSQLVRVITPLDSDAAGLGVLQFENALKQSPADNAAVIVQQPMGRFVLAASSLGVEYTPGVFGQASLEFVEAA
jgi:hypothetical protein